MSNCVATGTATTEVVKASENVWELTLAPLEASEASRNARIVEHVRPLLERALRERPEESELVWNNPFGTIRARLRPGPSRPGGPIRLTFMTPCRPFLLASQPGRSRADAAPAPTPPALLLPDPAIQARGERLVGLDGMCDDIQLRWGCQWDHGLNDQSVAFPLPSALRSYLEHTGSLLVFAGDPGLGKTELAHFVADRYCRSQGITGALLRLTTETRGAGTVGDFSQRIWAAFRALIAEPADFRCLLVDEADALAMRRSDAASHQEDKAATDTLLQCLDALVGTPRVAVILTTNRLEALDPALLRRALVFRFARPDTTARRALIRPWLLDATGRGLDRAAKRAEGLTPADIERALAQAWMAAVGRGEPLTLKAAEGALRRAERTESV